MSDVMINVNDSIAAPDDTSILLKTDFVELRKLCDDSVKGFNELGGKPFEVWTSQTASKSQKITKLFLFESLQKFIKHCTRMCDRDSKTPSYDASATLSESSSLKLMSDQFASYIKHAEASLAAHNTQLSGITTQLCELQSCVDNTRMSRSSPAELNPKSDQAHAPNLTDVHSTPTSFSTPDDMKCYETYDLNFLEPELYDELTEFLSTQQSFVDENGHSVLAFGERYGYSGGKAPDTKPLPDIIAKIIQLINSKFGCNINSVLINKYLGVASYLPEHSDDESSIDPESDIFTMSVGQTRDVVFTDKFSKVETTLPVEDNSLYSMSRDSQNCFTHKIDKIKEDVLEDRVRFSLTFRTVGSIFRRSTVIVGDSNTKHLAFGDGKGTFGKGLPGKRVQAYKVGDISPIDCLSYANVVIQCGINDISEGSGQYHRKTSDIDVDQIFSEFKGKVSTICKLKKNINVFITPILPTRSVTYNARAVRFNRLIYSQIIDQNYYRCSMLNVSGLCDSSYRTDLLDASYSRGDAVHLNHRGTRYLANVMKDSIFRVYNSGRRNRINSRKPYNVALQSGPPGPGTPNTS